MWQFLNIWHQKFQDCSKIFRLQCYLATGVFSLCWAELVFHCKIIYYGDPMYSKFSCLGFSLHMDKAFGIVTTNLRNSHSWVFLSMKKNSKWCHIWDLHVSKCLTVHIVDSTPPYYGPYNSLTISLQLKWPFNRQAISYIFLIDLFKKLFIFICLEQI